MPKREEIEIRIANGRTYRFTAQNWRIDIEGDDRALEPRVVVDRPTAATRVRLEAFGVEWIEPPTATETAELGLTVEEYILGSMLLRTRDALVADGTIIHVEGTAEIGKRRNLLPEKNTDGNPND